MDEVSAPLAASTMTLAPATAVGMLDSTSAPLIDMSLAKGATQSPKAEGCKNRRSLHLPL